MSDRYSLYKAGQNAYGDKPTLNYVNNYASMINADNLMRLTRGIFDVYLPKHWEVDYIIDSLILEGAVYVFKINDTIYCLRGTSLGIDAYNYPTNLIITNPVLGDHERTLSINSAVIRLTPYGTNTWYNTILYYAYRLASCDSAIDINLFNSRTPFIFGCDDKKTADSAKAIYDSISRGEPAVFTKYNNRPDSDMSIWTLPIKNNYIVNDICDARQTVLNEYLTLIGINNANRDKRERLNADEVNSNNIEIKTYLYEWSNRIDRCWDNVTALYPELKDYHIMIRRDLLNDNINKLVSNMDINTSTPE